MAHPLRAHVRSEQELRFISNLGNVDNRNRSGMGSSPNNQQNGTRLSQQKRIAQSMRDEKGERISQDQQAAIIKAMQALEEEQEAALERRDAILEKTEKVYRKLAEVNERIAGIEEENAGVQAHVQAVKADIEAAKEDREAGVKRLEEMRAENEVVKSRTLAALDLKLQKLKQDIRDTDRALKQAIWSSGSTAPVSPGVGADAPLPPLPTLEPIVLAVERRKHTVPETTRAIKKYQSLADARLKDVGEIQRVYASVSPVRVGKKQQRAVSAASPACTKKSSPPLKQNLACADVFQQMLAITSFESSSSHQQLRRGGPNKNCATPAASRSTARSASVPAFRVGVPPLPSAYHDIGCLSPQESPVSAFADPTRQPRRARTAGTVRMRLARDDDAF